MEEMAMGHINFKAWDLGGDIQGSYSNTMSIITIFYGN